MDTTIMVLSVHTVKPELIDFPIPEMLQLLAMHSNLPKLQQLLSFEPGCRDVVRAFECRNAMI